MRRFSVLSLLSLAHLFHCACGCASDFLDTPYSGPLHHHDHHDHHDARHLRASGRQLAPKAPVDWSYKPNYNYQCDAVGCCGRADDANPKREPCGPGLWQFLDQTANSRCLSTGSANQQSPINIASKGPGRMNFTDMLQLVKQPSEAHPVFSASRCEGALDTKDNTWQVAFPAECALTVDLLGKRWKMLQFHLHNSEHTVDGLYFPLEIHMVHKNDDNEYLVLGVFLTPGSDNAFFKAVETPTGPASNATRLVSPYDIIPPGRRYWHYKGSLTTPPCQVADGAHIEWFVFKDPTVVSMEQMAFFSSYFTGLSKSYHGMVNRPVQPVNANTQVYEYPVGEAN